MTIQIVVNGKPRTLYMPWRFIHRWPHVAAFAKGRYEHGRVSILRGLLVLEQW